MADRCKSTRQGAVVVERHGVAVQVEHDRAGASVCGHGHVLPAAVVDNDRVLGINVQIVLGLKLGAKISIIVDEQTVTLGHQGVAAGKQESGSAGSKLWAYPGGDRDSVGDGAQNRCVRYVHIGINAIESERLSYKARGECGTIHQPAIAAHLHVAGVAIARPPPQEPRGRHIAACRTGAWARTRLCVHLSCQGHAQVASTDRDLESHRVLLGMLSRHFAPSEMGFRSVDESFRSLSQANEESLVFIMPFTTRVSVL